MCVSVEGLLVRAGLQKGDLLQAEDRVVELSGMKALAHDLDGIAYREDSNDLDRFRKNRAPDDEARLKRGHLHKQPA
jgi:hypothetical protein